MLPTLAGILGFFLALTAHAETCTFSDNPLLGYWTASSVSVERRNHTQWTCSQLAIRFECAKNNELEVSWAYRCGTNEDWMYGGKKSMPVQGDRLLGQDGYLRAGEFYWDALIPNVSGTKIELKNGHLEIGENPEDYYPEDIFRATVRKVDSEPFPMFPRNHFKADQLHGKWTGEMKIIRAGKTVTCPVPSWELHQQNHVMRQVHVYLASCEEPVNFYVGPHFFRGDQLFDYPRDQSSRLIQQGTVSPTGFARKYDGYVVLRDEVTIDGDRLLYKFFTRDAEYRMELRRP